MCRGVCHQIATGMHSPLADAAPAHQKQVISVGPKDVNLVPKDDENEEVERNREEAIVKQVCSGELFRFRGFPTISEAIYGVVRNGLCTIG